MARISLSELRTRASTVDQAKVDATTEADILAQRAEDPDAPPEVPADARTVESPRSLRVRLGMTQPEMAAALAIPLGTWRNWEQGRVSLEPAARALLRVVSHNSEVALEALAQPEQSPILSAPPARGLRTDEEIRARVAEIASMLESEGMADVSLKQFQAKARA